MINQLFTKNPDREIILDILSAFGYQNFNNIDQPFNKKDLEKKKTVEKMQKLKPKLEEYYIPCKAKIYLKKKLTSRSIMTILRQFLKSEGYFLNYWESYIDGIKTTYYQIKEDNKVIKDKKYVVSFS
jgi:arsenate reductase-like glutaredoxin family protein